jgi:hypothetical protein
MRQFRIVAGAFVALSMLSVSVAAEARPRWHHDRGWRHRGGGIDAGDLILGAIIAGGIFAAVSAAKKNGGGLGGLGGTNRDRRDDRLPDDPQAREDEAASLCADAAERTARADDANARVRDITSVTPDGADGWQVEGVLESSQGRSYRDRSFTCRVIAGQIDFVRFGNRDRVAFR